MSNSSSLRVELLEKKVQNKKKFKIQDYLKSIVYGGIDGILTISAIVSSSYSLGSSTTNFVILIIGISNVFSDGISMALGDYFSTKTFNKFYTYERQREKWEFKHCYDAEKEELQEILGVGNEDCSRLLEILRKYENVWLDCMMTHELGLNNELEDPKMNGMVTFASFLFFGTIPLLPYIIASLFSLDQTYRNTIFIVYLVFTCLTLFLLGFLKSRFSIKSWYVSGLETLILGALVAFIGYYISIVIEPHFE